MWSDWLVVCDCGFSLSALWCPLSAPTVLLGFLLPWSWGSQGKNTEVVCHSLLQWTTVCQPSPPWSIHLGWPHMAWLSFIELYKAVVHVIILTSCLWLWFQCVCPLMPSRNTYCLTWVSCTLVVGYLFTAAPAKCYLYPKDYSKYCNKVITTLITYSNL